MSISVVMYHYIRNNEEHEYDTYCRRVSEFEAQISFLTKQFPIVNPSNKEEIEHYRNHDNKRAILLTFDDGYKDHFYCAEFLHSLDLKGAFFPPINALEGDLLDVNAIHAIIGCREANHQQILNDLIREIKARSLDLILGQSTTRDIDLYVNSYQEHERMDTRNVVLIKRLLQRDIISEKARHELCNDMIQDSLQKSAKEVAYNLYLSVQQISYMYKLGMVFGCHGLTHRWLKSLSSTEQSEEITKSFAKLHALGAISGDNPCLMMCYPYGSFNDDTLSQLRSENVDYAVTTKVGECKQQDDPLQIPRWDTNDFWNTEWRRPTLPY